MNDGTREGDPDWVTERLIDDVVRGTHPAGDPVADLLAAAATPDLDRALAREHAAVAAFQAAGPTRPTRRLRPWPLLRAISIATLTAVTVGSIAMAADRSVLPLFPHRDPHPPSHPIAPRPPRLPSPTTDPTPTTTDPEATSGGSPATAVTSPVQNQPVRKGRRLGQVSARRAHRRVQVGPQQRRSPPSPGPHGVGRRHVASSAVNRHAERCRRRQGRA
jgi:hypothetical protein